MELAPDRINVNTIAPGLIVTPQKRLDNPAERGESMQAIAWRRLGQPKEIADLATFCYLTQPTP